MLYMPSYTGYTGCICTGYVPGFLKHMYWHLKPYPLIPEQAQHHACWRSHLLFLDHRQPQVWGIVFQRWWRATIGLHRERFWRHSCLLCITTSIYRSTLFFLKSGRNIFHAQKTNYLWQEGWNWQFCSYYKSRLSKRNGNQLKWV